MNLLIYGEDSFGSWRKLKLIKERFFSSQDQNNFHEISSDVIESVDLTDLLQAQSLWAGHRLIIFREILSGASAQTQSRLLETLKTISDPNLTIVFWETQKFDKRLALFKFLNLPKLSEEFLLPTPSQLSSRIIQMGKDAGINLSPAQINRLIDIAHSDLWGIYNEIQKISSAPSADLVEQLFSPSTTVAAFALQDAISKSDPKLIQHTIRLQIDNGEEPYLLLGGLVSTLRNIIRIRQLLDQGTPAFTIAQLIKLHPYVVTKLLTVCQNHPLSYWIDIFMALSDLDWKSKTGATNISDSLELVSLKTT